METAQYITEVFKKIFKIEYPISEFADGFVEQSHYYKAISEYVLGSYQFEQYASQNTPADIIFETAIKLIASSFSMEDQYFHVEADILERKIMDSLNQLSVKELSGAYNYFYPLREWKLKEEFKRGDDYFECDYERLKLTTVIEMLHIIIMADLDLYLLQVKIFLNYQTERSFFYNLIDDDGEDTEERIKSILA